MSHTRSGCCSVVLGPPPDHLPRTRAWHRRADTVLAATRPVIVPAAIALAIVASIAGDRLSGRSGLMFAPAFFVVLGAWCVLNFVRSREAHCVVTGFGSLALALVGLGSAAAGIDWTDSLWLAFAAVLLAGCLFESTWAATHATNAVRANQAIPDLARAARRPNTGR